MVKKIGIYDLGEKIGQGNYGTVYTATHRQTQQKVAAKQVPIRFLNGKLMAQLQQEIKILKKVQSPFVIKLITVLKTQNNIYLIMEHCPGGDLQKYLKTHGPIDQQTAKKWLSQLVDALISLQNNQVMHRDLKLANILLTSTQSDAQLRVADFGFARFLQEQSLAITQLGTPMFMAPQIFNNQHYSFKADVWSLGVLSYQMMTSKMVFICRTLAQLKKEQTKPVIFPQTPQLSEDARNFVQAMLTYNHQQRPSFEELKEFPFLRGVFSEIDEGEYVDLMDSDQEGFEELKESEDEEEVKCEIQMEIVSDLALQTIELDSQVTQVQEILEFFEVFQDQNNSFGSLAVSYFCRNKFRQFAAKAEGLSREHHITRSQDYMFSEIFDRIHLDLCNAGEMVEKVSGKLNISIENLSSDTLNLLAEALVQICAQRNQVSKTLQYLKQTLQLLIVATELSPQSQQAALQFQQVNEEFENMKKNQYRRR